MEYKKSYKVDYTVIRDGVEHQFYFLTYAENLPDAIYRCRRVITDAFVINAQRD
jgi:hypothetical protein